jgi:hypothetical protein
MPGRSTDLVDGVSAQPAADKVTARTPSTSTTSPARRARRLLELVEKQFSEGNKQVTAAIETRWRRTPRLEAKAW